MADMRAIDYVCLVQAKTLYIRTFITLCLWFVIEFFCVLRSRNGKYTCKKIFDGNSFYVHANVAKWRTGAKVVTLGKMKVNLHKLK